MPTVLSNVNELIETGILGVGVSLPVYFENAANAAMLAEKPGRLGDCIFLSLKNTLGGAVCIDEEIEQIPAPTFYTKDRGVERQKAGR